jgi:hypothetical protein
MKKVFKVSKKSLVISSVFGFLLCCFSVVGMLIKIKEKESSVCQPFNIFVSKTGENSIDIQWETEGNCLGYVLYGEDVYEIERVAVNTDSLKKENNHSIYIFWAINYYNVLLYCCISEDEAYGKNGKPISLLLKDIQ